MDYSIALILKLGFDVFCMTDAMINEASVDGDEGMKVTAQLILERTNSDNFPNSICAVIKQPSNNPERPAACAFSYTCDGKEDIVEEKDIEEYLRVSKLAMEVMSGKYVSPVDGADHYLLCKRKREWLHRMTFLGKIGSHCYYEEWERR